MILCSYTLLLPFSVQSSNEVSDLRFNAVMDSLTDFRRTVRQFAMHPSEAGLGSCNVSVWLLFPLFYVLFA